MNAVPATAMSLGLAGCEVCGLVSRPPAGTVPHCPRCGEKLHFRRPASIERCWALVIAALLLYLPANLLPVLTTYTPLGSQTDTIMQGVVELWSGDLPVQIDGDAFTAPSIRLQANASTASLLIP